MFFQVGQDDKVDDDETFETDEPNAISISLLLDDFRTGQEANIEENSSERKDLGVDNREYKNISIQDGSTAGKSYIEMATARQPMTFATSKSENRDSRNNDYGSSPKLDEIDESNDESDSQSPSQSLEGSLFSIAATGYSTLNTQYSEPEITYAMRQLVQLLWDDEELQILYRQVIQCASIGLHRFTRNFRRLLQRYSKDLKEEASESLEYQAAGFLRIKAGEVAKAIAAKQDMTVDTPKKDEQSSSQQQEIGTASDSEESDQEDLPPQQASIESLVSVKEFLTQGTAFRNLKTNFETFIRRAGTKSELGVESEQENKMMPEERQLTGLSLATIQEIADLSTSSLEDKTNSEAKVEEKVFESDLKNTENSSSLFPEANRPEIETRNQDAETEHIPPVHQSLAQFANNRQGLFRRFLTQLGIMERPIAPGKARLRWKCVSHGSINALRETC